ncbi:hypothetical protein [Pontibacter fetidus]|uniref:Uncharacterized protein n=1 Tax=Pontibacter fetidus TaxID=2700082 RepID=A0A6B2GWA0_9BACT|nr:hypothetical protein [Pontibacter fetidus]NDK55199.1 hypothetical protein [Pontibacter fetidus]
MSLHTYFSTIASESGDSRTQHVASWMLAPVETIVYGYDQTLTKIAHAARSHNP